MPYLSLPNFNYDSGPRRIQSGPNHEGYVVLYSGVQSTGADDGIVVAGTPLSGTLASGAWGYDANWRYVPSTLPGQNSVLDPTPYNVSGALGTYDGARIYTRNTVAGAQIASAIGPETGAVQPRGGALQLNSNVTQPEKYMYFGGAAPDNQNYSPYNTPDANSAAEGKTGGGVTHRTFESSLLTNVLGSQGTSDRSQWRYHQPVYCKTYTETKRSEVPGLMSTPLRAMYRGGSTSYNYNYGSELLASRGGVGGGGGLYAKLEEGVGDGGTSVGITLTGPLSVLEGSITDPYIVSLDGITLEAGQSLIFTVDSESGSATENVDFGALTAVALSPAVGITLSSISTNGITGVITVTATNTSGNTLASGAELLRFTIAAFSDSLPEGPETFAIRLASLTINVVVGEIITTIIDSDVDPTVYTYWRVVSSNGFMSGWDSTAASQGYYFGAGPGVNPQPGPWKAPTVITLAIPNISVGGGLGTIGFLNLITGQAGGYFGYVGVVDNNNPRLVCDPTAVFEFSNNQVDILATWAGRP